MHVGVERELGLLQNFSWLILLACFDEMGKIVPI